MLKNNLYRVSALDELPDEQQAAHMRKYAALVELDGSNGIFHGHFPGHPVLPGVCQVEMVRELAEEILACPLLLSQASQIKYLSLINPIDSPLLGLNLKFSDTGQDQFDVSAEVTSGETVCMKMRGRLTVWKR